MPKAEAKNEVMHAIAYAAANHSGPGIYAERVKNCFSLRRRSGNLARAFGFKPRHQREAVSGARIGGNEAA